MVICKCPKRNKQGSEFMNKILLEFEMKKKGISISKMCKAIGISKSAYYRKCKGISEFTQGEIMKIVKVLGISSPIEIFFADLVS